MLDRWSPSPSPTFRRGAVIAGFMAMSVIPRPAVAANRALAFGFGGYADLDLTFGEFFADDHTVTLRFMPQFPYAGPGSMLAGNGSGTYAIGQGDFRWNSLGGAGTGPATLFIQVGGQRATYDVTGFADGVGGPVGYRNVWQQLAVVRSGPLMKLYLNGQELTATDGQPFTVPAAGVPSAGTPLRLGRRTNGTTAGEEPWQYYGLIDDIAVYKKALTSLEIAQAMDGQLGGSEAGLYAGWRFDSGPQRPVFSRPVHIPSAAEVADYVNPHASHPVPVYHVGVSDDLDSASDSTRMDVRPSMVQARPPFSYGEIWKVVQGWAQPGSHNGLGAAFCWDFARVAAPTGKAAVHAAADGRVIMADQLSSDDRDNAMMVYHTPVERAVYMHLDQGSYSKYFPGAPAPPQDQPVTQQPEFSRGTAICDIGDEFDEPTFSAHLHFCTSLLLGETVTPPGYPEAGPPLPNALTGYYSSSDQGATWQKVTLGVPQPAEWVSLYPWSPLADEPRRALAPAPSVVAWGENRLDVFVRGANSHLWHRRWSNQGQSPGWSAWTDLEGVLTSEPTAVSWGPNRLDVFARGGEGQLLHKRWSPIGASPGWSEWRDLGGSFLGRPAAVSWGPNRIDVFVRDSDNRLAHKRYSPLGTDPGWSEWRDLGGRLTSDPVAVSWGENRLDVFVRGHDGQLAHKRWSNLGTAPGWSGWRDLGGRLTSAPHAVSWGENRLDVFVRGHDGQLAHKRWSNAGTAPGWSEWRDLGGRLTSAPYAVSWGENRLDVFVRGHAGQLAHKRWSNLGESPGWSGWRNLGGRLSSAPAATSWGPNRLDVFVLGSTHRLAHKRWSNLGASPGWSDWRNLDADQSQ